VSGPAAPTAGPRDKVQGAESLTAKALLESALAKITPPEGQQSDFPGARTLLEEVRKQRPNDPFVIQQLALATYKSKQPTPEAALIEAQQVLRDLGPATTNDPETLGLWGAVHKRLWELKGQPQDLSEAIGGYERGFYLKQDWYNGINLAFLLQLRAIEFLRSGQKDEGMADAVQANRVRRDVLRYAQAAGSKVDQDALKKYWIVATEWEAALGLGDVAEQARLEAELKAMPVPAWMQETRVEQGNKLQKLQHDYATLLAHTA
jgi:muconolactone delta-isomerase